MAKINTMNYQPVTAWNGTQDLFVVEQPDGTKVATPEQVKQYVEAGDFEATGEIIDGHGNILAKKADVTTVTTTRHTPTQAGWRRICKIKPVDMQTADGMIYVGGYWSNGQPPSASVAVSVMQTAASLTLLSSAFAGNKKITAMRLINATGAEFWLDVYFPAYSNWTGPFKFIFTGDIAVSDIQDPVSITTDPTAASAEISLDQKVNGTVLTDESGVETISGTGSYGCTYTAYKYGRIVQLSIKNIDNATTGQVMQLFTLPEGWRPVIESNGVGTYNYGSYDAVNNAVSFRIRPNGIIYTYSYHAFESGSLDIIYISE
jgi:hypothetical protein